MSSRRRARELAMQALYQCDTLDDWSEEAVDLFFKVYGEADTSDGVLDEEHSSFSRKLISGVLESRSDVDAEIVKASEHWSLPRMSRVDRNILRVAAYEISFLEDIPVSVSINEAIEIAKRYSTPESPVFINGVLDKIGSSKAKAAPMAKVAANE